MSVQPALRAESISKSFGDRRILTVARIEAKAGEITLVAGRNGAGKSTLLRILAGDLAADSGVVHFAGLTLSSPRLHQLARRGLFFLPDRGILSPSVAISTQLEAIATRFRTRAALSAAELLGIRQVIDRKPLEISQGELRRAEVALAMARKPACLIADEPLRGIDPKDAEDILRVFRAMTNNGCAVIVSGHDVAPLMAATDKIVWVTAGTTYELGTSEMAERNDHFRRDYLTGRW